MTSRFILDEFDLDLSSSSLLVRLGFLVVIVFIDTTVGRIAVLHEYIFRHRLRSGWWRRVAICGRVGTLAFAAHIRRSGRQAGLLHVQASHRMHCNVGWDRKVSSRTCFRRRQGNAGRGKKNERKSTDRRDAARSWIAGRGNWSGR